MPCRCCSFGDAAEQQFTSERVAKELRHYRRKGAGPTTRLLRDGLATAGLARGTLLDVGGGLGALTLDLLDLGMSRAVVVEASSAYLAAAAEEADRGGRSSSIQFVHGDFLAVTKQLPRSTVVTLDRVRTFVHSPSAMQRLVERAGFELANRHCNVAWFADGFVKKRPSSGMWS